MTNVDVRYHNVLRHAAGAADENVALGPGATVSDLVVRVAQSHGDPLCSMLLDPDGTISAHIVVLHNRHLVRQDRRDVPVEDGDEVMLFPAIAGG